MAHQENTAHQLPGQLFFSPINSKLTKLLEQAQDIMEKYPEILDSIKQDQDQDGLEEKYWRTIDQVYSLKQNQTFSFFDGSRQVPRPSQLYAGRPRLSPQAVYFFHALRGYHGSLSGKNWQTVTDSMTARSYLEPWLRKRKWPGETTVLENLNVLSEKTQEKILCAQCDIAQADKLDDFLLEVIDSTAVEANSDFPSDSGTIMKLLNKIWNSANRLLTKLELPPWGVGWTNIRLKKIKRLDFRINTANRRRTRRKLYRPFLDFSSKLLTHFEEEASRSDELLSKVEFYRPSRRYQAMKAWDQILQLLFDADEMIVYSYLRQFGEEDAFKNSDCHPIYSVSDRAARFIKKGKRPVVFGYKIQIARSSGGLISGLDVPLGNVPDCLKLKPMVQLHQRITGVLPESVSADDGYASRKEWLAVEKMGVQNISISGSKGKKLIPQDLYNSTTYQNLRRIRSPIESMIFILKYAYGCDRVHRRGLAGVRAELLEKAIAYNFHRLSVLRKRKASAERWPNSA